MNKKNFFNKKTERIAVITACFLVFLLIIAIIIVKRAEKITPPVEVTSGETSSAAAPTEAPSEPVSVPEVTPTEAPPDVETSESVSVDPAWQYAENSMIKSGTATLIHAKPSIRNNITVCINAGHGTEGGSSVKTLCHPDGTPKVTGGTTDEGETMAVAVSSGCDLLDGTSEADANLAVALVVRDLLLEKGYDVLMIRDSSDVQLDNIARTLLANHFADCHIAIHYDSTDMDKGVYFMSVPSDSSYRSMEPVASNWEKHNALGTAVTKTMEELGMKLFEGGAMEMDLTQTSYSTVPSIDLEVGDRSSEHSPETVRKTAEAIAAGIDAFFGVSREDSTSDIYTNTDVYLQP